MACSPEPATKLDGHKVQPHVNVATVHMPGRWAGRVDVVRTVGWLTGIEGKGWARGSQMAVGREEVGGMGGPVSAAAHRGSQRGRYRLMQCSYTLPRIKFGTARFPLPCRLLLGW